MNKPLLAAGEIGNRWDAFLQSDGGVLVPKDGLIGRGMRKEFQRLKRKHGIQETVALYKEKGVYNMYMKEKPGMRHLDSVSASQPSGNKGQGKSL